VTGEQALLKQILNSPIVNHESSSQQTPGESAAQSEHSIPMLINDKPAFVAPKSDKVTMVLPSFPTIGFAKRTKKLWNSSRLRVGAALTKIGIAKTHQQVGLGNDLALTVQSTQRKALVVADVLQKGIKGNKWVAEVAAVEAKTTAQQLNAAVSSILVGEETEGLQEDEDAEKGHGKEEWDTCE